MKNKWLIPVIVGIGYILYRAMGKKGGIGTPNFSKSEFDCRDGSEIPTQYHANLQALMEQMEIIRKAAGNKRIKVNSGYRSPSYNASIGGASASQHMLAKACDFTIEGMSPYQTWSLVYKLRQEGKIMKGGLGRYNTFTHYDVRGTNANWDNT